MRTVASRLFTLASDLHRDFWALGKGNVKVCCECEAWCAQQGRATRGGGGQGRWQVAASPCCAALQPCQLNRVNSSHINL